MNDGFFCGIEFGKTFWEIIQWNEMAADVAYLVFVRLAYIENNDIVLGVQALLKIFDVNQWNVRQNITPFRTSYLGSVSQSCFVENQCTLPFWLRSRGSTRIPCSSKSRSSSIPSN